MGLFLLLLVGEVSKFIMLFCWNAIPCTAIAIGALILSKSKFSCRGMSTTVSISKFVRNLLVWSDIFILVLEVVQAKVLLLLLRMSLAAHIGLMQLSLLLRSPCFGVSTLIISYQEQKQQHQSLEIIKGKRIHKHHSALLPTPRKSLTIPD